MIQGTIQAVTHPYTRQHITGSLKELLKSLFRRVHGVSSILYSIGEKPGNQIPGLARTLRDGSSSKYSTPLEVAHQHGWTHLYDILNPVVRRHLHSRILHKLQSRLHDLIREAFETDPEAHLECFRLPELEILTVFEHSRLWFPLQPELKDSREGLAVQIILDCQELVVVVRWGRLERKLYRISSWETKEIQQAIVLRP
jgi:hypothetical protein